MVGYNGKYYSFKLYMPTKPIMHKIKSWALAYASTKIVLKLQDYVKAWNEMLLEIPKNACRSGAGVVTSSTMGMENNHYTVIMDNFFSSLLLFDDLLKPGFYVVNIV